MGSALLASMRASSSRETGSTTPRRTSTFPTLPTSPTGNVWFSGVRDVASPSEYTPSAMALATLGRSGDGWSLAAQLRSVAPLIVRDTKLPFLRSALTASQSPDGARHSDLVYLHNGKALQSLTRGLTDPSRSECLFAQLGTVLHGLSDTALRAPTDGSGKLFRVKFKTFDASGGDMDEAGIDAGGLFREAFAQAVQDLFSPSTLTLFLPAPNPSDRFGGKGTFVPNPGATSAKAIQLFEAVGIVMGFSIRNDRPHGFQLPSLVWKRILGTTPTLADLRVVDETAADAIETMRERALLVGVTEDADEPDDAAPMPDIRTLPREVPRSDKQLATLPPSALPASGRKPGTPYTRQEVLRYCEAVLELRLTEHEAAYEAMRRGLGRVVPRAALSLFAWNELESMVCGEASIDVGRLKQHTRYLDPFSATHPVMVRFWEVVEGFTDAERQLLIQFAWGRNRLPPVGQWKESEPFKIGPIGNSTRRARGDAEFPLSHTCFFQIELPEYTNVRVMRERLLMALHGSVGAILNV